MSAGGDVADAGAPDRLVAIGDAALLLTIGDRVDPELAERAGAIAAAIDTLRPGQPAIGRAVPANATVLVPFDPLAIDLETATGLVQACAAGVGRADLSSQPQVPIEIVVRYGGDDGPDLAEVATLHDLRPSDVVELHAGATYQVLFLGFAPGFAYLGGLPARLATPRRATPRARVPAGSVGIAGEQTGVYPLVMPGGWNLIGRTDAGLWDVGRPSPALLRPGDRVRFVPAR